MSKPKESSNDGLANIQNNDLDDESQENIQDIHDKAVQLMETWEQARDPALLSEAVTMLEQVVKYTGDNDSTKPYRLRKLANALTDRFDRFGGLADLEKGIALLQQSLVLAGTGHTFRPKLLHNLANALQSRLWRLGDIADIEKAIDLEQQSVELTPEGDDDLPSRMNSLGNAFLSRYLRLGKVTDLDKAIGAHRQMIALTEHAPKPTWVKNFGNDFYCRFQHLGELNDLEQAISLYKQAVNLTSGGDIDRPTLLDSLGLALCSQFQRLGRLEDIGEAIYLQQEAVNLTPDGHAGKATRLANLGLSLRSRFEHLGELTDIENAIDAQRKAVHLTPKGDARRPDRLTNLGISLWCRSKHVTGLTDINDAIEVQTQALDLTPDNHTDKPGHIENLAVTLHSRFELLGEVKDLDYAITLKQQAVNLTADGHRGKPSRLGNLSASFLRRFERLGELADLEQAITVQQQVVYLTPQGHADLPSRLDHLSSYLLRRYERLWELSDLQQAIVVQQRAVKLTPKGHTDKASRLNHLGIALQLRYERLGKLADGKNAILAKQQAVGLLANNNKLKPSLLQSLGNAFQSRFDDLHKLADVNHAIDFQQQAVGLTPEKDTHRSNRLHSLGNGFQSRFELLANLSDIDEAISFKQQAVELMPDGHADKPSKHYSLGSAYRSRFKSSADSSDLASALSAFQNACSAIAGDPSVQLDAAIDWANLCSDPQSALPAYEQIFQLIPRVVWLGQTIGHRYTELTRIGRMVNSAVAAAIAVGDFPKAVEWLEEGRGVVWGDILQLRSPLDELDTQYPHLAKKLKQVSRDLETAGRSSRSKKFEESKSRTALTGEQEAQKHTKLADEYQKLITEIREKDGFGSFLRPKKLSELLPAADNGPIVIVNVAKASCDALILPSSSSSIIHVPLPTFSVEQGQKLHSKLLSSLTAMHVRMGRNGLRMKPKMAQNSVANDSGGTKDFQSVLAELWTHVVQPILSQLGLTEPSDNPEDRLPQITWCTTGALAFHPLHAAGIYGSRDPRENVKTSDFVISSYTPTLTALINSASKIKPIEKPSVLIISQPATKDLDPLPGTRKEAEEIELCVSSDYTKHLTDDQATITAVTTELSKHEIVHLACHGIQDSKDPLGSSFALHDGGLNLQALMGLSLDNVRLAVLSACQTATGDKKLPEEAVHLAAGMLAVGYPSVIATMWSIGDEDAPRVARSVYASLFDKQEGENMGGLDSAYALHEAVEHLREEVGEMNFVKWVPFVHFGI